MSVAIVAAPSPRRFSKRHAKRAASLGQPASLNPSRGVRGGSCPPRHVARARPMYIEARELASLAARADPWKGSSRMGEYQSGTTRGRANVAEGAEGVEESPLTEEA